ncbi:Uncharacterised protein [Salmonella sp. NCTC 11881]|nr:Uncharacterised protein [Salmonella sp. NCTC 11881]
MKEIIVKTDYEKNKEYSVSGGCDNLLQHQ